LAEKPVLVIDSSVLIEAARRYYAFDVAPGFWEGLVLHCAEGRVCSIDWVKKELEKGNDRLADWADSDAGTAFVPTTDDDVLAQYAEIMDWVTRNRQFHDSAKADFASGADGWVVAYAKAKGHVVVTQEVLRRDVKRKVPIPNVCDQFGVRWIDTFAMLRELGIKLKL
jgi:hypothetical protein